MRAAVATSGRTSARRRSPGPASDRGTRACRARRSVAASLVTSSRPGAAASDRARFAAGAAAEHGDGSGGEGRDGAGGRALGDDEDPRHLSEVDGAGHVRGATFEQPRHLGVVARRRGRRPAADRGRPSSVTTGHAGGAREGVERGRETRSEGARWRGRERCPPVAADMADDGCPPSTTRARAAPVTSEDDLCRLIGAEG